MSKKKFFCLKYVCLLICLYVLMYFCQKHMLICYYVFFMFFYLFPCYSVYKSSFFS